MTVRPGRTITVKLQIDAVRGDFHAQQAWNGCYMSGRWRCPFAFVPAEKYGNFQAFCDQIESKLAVGLSAMNDASDFYKIAAQIASLEEGDTEDLGWCKVGDNTKNSQVYGPAPWAKILDFTNRTTSQPNDVTTHGFKNAALTPDPEHCLMAIIKNVFYEFEQKMSRAGPGRTILKQKIKQYCGRDSYDEYMDGHNWRQFVFNYIDIMQVALRAEGKGGVPEADLLLSTLRDIVAICAKSRAEMQAHHILRCKLCCFAFARSMERLVSSCYFTKRPINLYFTWLSIYLPYTIGHDRSKGQVIPSECSTQFQESRWAHLRALMLRSNRGGGVIEDGRKGSAWLLDVIADDQAHLIYCPEYGLHGDNSTARGESLMTRLERQAEETTCFNLNTHIPQWVFQQDGVDTDWERFQKLFLTDYTEGRDYFTSTNADDVGIIGCTAETEAHRQHSQRAVVRQHLLRLPVQKSVATNVSKHVRLVITPPVSEEGEDVTSGAAVLVFRTKVTDIISSQHVDRPATETVQHVRREQLAALCAEYRQQYQQEHEQRPSLRDMTVDARNGEDNSLRCELWEWFEAKGMLDDDLLRGIFTDEVLGEFSWVSIETTEPRAASGPAPQPTAHGWRSIWTIWGWAFSNGAGAVQLVDPGAALTGEERAEGLGAPAATDAEPVHRYQPPAAAHSVAAMEEDREQVV
eukprot:COSAG02_NODE_1932_length_10324_cov_92.894963_7_plen_690_part_00